MRIFEGTFILLDLSSQLTDVADASYVSVALQGLAPESVAEENVPPSITNSFPSSALSAA